jgi:hypothetical protein
MPKREFHPRRRRCKEKNIGHHYERVIALESLDDVPRELGKDLYIVRRGQKDRWLVVACPCGCGDKIEANLMRTHYPHWRLKRHNDSTVSLRPSLWVSEERCGSHFWLIRSRVVWAFWEQEN